MPKEQRPWPLHVAAAGDSRTWSRPQRDSSSCGKLLLLRKRKTRANRVKGQQPPRRRLTVFRVLCRIFKSLETAKTQSPAELGRSPGPRCRARGGGDALGVERQGEAPSRKRGAGRWDRARGTHSSAGPNPVLTQLSPGFSEPRERGSGRSERLPPGPPPGHRPAPSAQRPEEQRPLCCGRGFSEQW